VSFKKPKYQLPYLLADGGIGGAVDVVGVGGGAGAGGCPRYHVISWNLLHYLLRKEIEKMYASHSRSC
jgi:hypothetical protein